MQDQPKFMSREWQRKLMREQPKLFWLLATVLAFPIVFTLRLGINGEFGSVVQAVIRILGLCLLLGCLWLLIAERWRRKKRNSLIDAYLEQRYEQTHERGPPSS